MGAGNYGAGIGSAGADPVLPATLRELFKRPESMLFDPATGDFRLLSGGLFEAIHPVDQAVALALTIRKGTLRSAPTVGHTLRELPRAGSATLKTDAEYRARAALAKLVAGGDIRINGVTVTTPVRGQVIIVVEYMNLRLVPAVLQAQRVVLNG